MRPYLQILYVEAVIEKCITDEQWKALEKLERLLRPFKRAQKVLEGQAYVTISLLPMIVATLREGLADFISRLNDEDDVKALAVRLLEDFNARWGKGENGTVWHEYDERAERNRMKGIPRKALIASALDPRTKFLPLVQKWTRC